MDIRKTALIALIAAVVGTIGPLWNAVDRAFGLGVTGSNWWIVPLMVLTILFTTLMPVFYFALYRDDGVMRFPTYLRKVALAAAVACAIVALLRLRTFAGTWTWGTAIGPLTNVTYILLLLAMSRDAREAPSQQSPPADLLVGVTKLVVVVWGAWVSFQFVRLVMVWSTYSQLENFAFQVGRAAPSRRAMMADLLLTLFSQASILAAPFIVWCSGFGRGVPERVQL